MDDNDSFWAAQAQQLDWIKPYSQVFSGDFAKGDIQFFADGMLNVCTNCVDRHLANHAEKPAIIWQGDEPADQRVFTFQELHDEICKLANVLKERGIQKGDRVCIYMPMIPETVIAMLACARIGAIHTVVFAGFSTHALKTRLHDASACAIITAHIAKRGNKTTHLKATVDQAVHAYAQIHSVIVVNNTQEAMTYTNERELDYHHALSQVDTYCPACPMQAEDPLFILYTSGSSGKPKGVVHSTAGYLLTAAFSFTTVFELEADDIHWCAADIGWITGHSYIVYGPLANATTTLIFEGTPNYPDSSRLWQIIDEHQVSIFYTAPTVIRMLMAKGETPLLTTSRSSLRILGSVGEPINPEAWHWYFNKVGQSRCKVMDTWWQTETGGIMLAPLCDLRDQKPGAAMHALPGLEPVILDDAGKIQSGIATGQLAFSQPWPGMVRTIYGDHQRFLDTYLNAHPGFYITGDGVKRDKDGHYWVTGRIDDVLNVSGHRIATAEIESALVLHPTVCEAAVVGFAHDIKGEGMIAFVSLMENESITDTLIQELKEFVKEQVGPFASIDEVRCASELPKTRSGKIMRRILRKVASGEKQDFGDTATLADTKCLKELIQL